MDNPRKKIILNEILFWKQNKLLPEQYCNFLMTLYSEGEELELEEHISHKKSVKAKEKKSFLLVTSLILVISLGLVATLFLVSQAVGILAIISGIVAVAFIFCAFVYRKKQLLAPIFQIAAALILFGISVKCSTEYFPENPMLLVVLLMINCLLWLVMGLKQKLLYFTLSGAIGLIVIVCYYFIF